MTDGSRAISERYAYSAHGTPTITDATGTARTASAIGNRYTYTGREWDESITLYHYRARMYDSLPGSFVSRDTIGFEGRQFCLYGYVGTRPLVRWDPRGLIDENGNGEHPDFAGKPRPTLPPGTIYNPPGILPIPPLPPNSDPLLLCLAMGTCTWIGGDISIPEPTDICPPKWLCYTVAGAAAGITIVCMSDTDAIRERLRELGELAQTLRDQLARAEQRLEELRGTGRVEDMEIVQEYIDTILIRLEAIGEVIDELLGQL